MRSRPGTARTILLFHTISTRLPKQSRVVGSTLGVYSFGQTFVSARTNKRHRHLHIISARPSKQPRMVGSTLGVYSFGLIFVSARKNKRHKSSVTFLPNYHNMDPARLYVMILSSPQSLRSSTRPPPSVEESRWHRQPPRVLSACAHEQE